MSTYARKYNVLIEMNELPEDARWAKRIEAESLAYTW